MLGTRSTAPLRLRSLLMDVQRPDLLLGNIFLFWSPALRFAAQHLMIWWHQYRSW